MFRMYESLDFVYTPVEDARAAAQEFERLGAAYQWRVRAFGTVVACVRLAEVGPAILLAEHLHERQPILVFRVADYHAAVAELRAAGVEELLKSGIPHGPLASFRGPAGGRVAVYELTRPEAVNRFDGRFDD
jgi:hypothetical protein